MKWCHINGVESNFFLQNMVMHQCTGFDWIGIALFGFGSIGVVSVVMHQIIFYCMMVNQTKNFNSLQSLSYPLNIKWDTEGCANVDRDDL